MPELHRFTSREPGPMRGQTSTPPGSSLTSHDYQSDLPLDPAFTHGAHSDSARVGGCKEKRKTAAAMFHATAELEKGETRTNI